MPYEARWYLAHKVMEARFWGEVSINDTDQHSDACVQMLTEAQSQSPTSLVYLLFDALEAENFPPLYLHISQGIRVLKFKNRGAMFAITSNRGIRSIFEITAHLTREHFPLRLFSDRESAVQSLESYLARDRQRMSSQ